jgi:dienelactone hydrolase
MASIAWRSLAACAICLAGRFLISGGVSAEPFVVPFQVMPAAVVVRAASFATDLVFPDDAQSETDLTGSGQALIKPVGGGPFPAIVLMHQCAGVNPAVVAWARSAVQGGFVVLLIDSLTARNTKTVCYGPRDGVNIFRGARDAFQAAEHLRKYAFVDAARVSFVGFSWGASVGLIVSSARYAVALDGKPFARVASFYPACFRIERPNAPTFDLVSDDMKQPVLVLMGETDLEAPPEQCIPKLGVAREAGSLVEWHVYLGIGHCWDCRHLDGFSKIDARGTSVTYAYSEAVTRDSAQRLYSFLAASLHR